ncbi:MAG: PAS domain S-box protein, partial [Alphaproteobacteria bacterium]
MKPQAKKLLILEKNPADWLDFEKDSQNTAYPFQITIVSTIRDAKKMLKRGVFHSVISDFILTDGNCVEIIPDLSGTPMIIMTDEGNEDAIMMALKSGATEYLIKDSNNKYWKYLPLTINKALEHKNQEVELQKYRTQLENIVEERTIELIDMYSKLQESETNFRNVFNSTSESIIIVDYNYNFLEVNDAVLKQFGVTKEFLMSHDLLNYVLPEYKKDLIDRMEMVRHGIPSGNMEIEFMTPLHGKIMPYELNSVSIIFNQKNALLAIMHDITERKGHARKLFETIIQTEEEERKRIARDLHDEIGPLISALKIFTTSFIESHSMDKKNKLAGQMGSIVRDVIDSIKVISNDMSPHVLANFGLSAAILNFIELFSRSIHIKFSSNIEDIRFPTTVESLIYRIIKELIHNTVKHARASEISIHIDFGGNLLSCRYADNGIGFNWESQVEAPAKGMGIHNIITRIRSMG